MEGVIVKLGKDYHVVCDTRDHWYRSAQGSTFTSRKLEPCNCKGVYREDEPASSQDPA